MARGAFGGTCGAAWVRCRTQSHHHHLLGPTAAALTLHALVEPRVGNFCRVCAVRYIVTQGITVARANWHEQLRRGALDFAILLAVSPGPKYGLAIIQYLEQFTDLVVSEGTIYPILGRLTRDELLHAWWVENEAPHARKYYRLTPLGRKRLAEMKAEWSAFAEKIARLMQAAEGSVDAAQ